MKNAVRLPKILVLASGLLHAQRTAGIRSAQFTAERLFWHYGDHTARPESAESGRFLLFSVPRGRSAFPSAPSLRMPCSQLVFFSSLRHIASSFKLCAYHSTKNRSVKFTDLIQKISKTYGN